MHAAGSWTAEHPAGHSLSERPDTTRDHLRILRDVRGRAFGRLQRWEIRATGRQNAIAWVRANYAKPLRIEDLAKIAGMGVSTLHIISGR